MKKIFSLLIIALLVSVSVQAQNALPKVYDESIDRMAQVDAAIAKARQEGKYVMVQLGGNWCPWCLRFANFVNADEEVNQLMTGNFEYIHVNYSSAAKKLADHKPLMQRLGNPARFGFPVLIVLNEEGSVVHVQETGGLEQGEGYNKERVMRFLGSWTKTAVETLRE